MRPGLANMGIGLLIAVIGLAVTIGTYSAASGGGRYVVAWGAIAVGAWRFFVGLFQLLRS
jgi:hypothetical protein